MRNVLRRAGAFFLVACKCKRKLTQDTILLHSIRCPTLEPANALSLFPPFAALRRRPPLPSDEAIAKIASLRHDRFFTYTPSSTNV